MTHPIEEYKAFIDGLLGWPRISLAARQVREWDGVDPARRRGRNQLHLLLEGLSAEQRQILADLLQDERDSGIHETLAYLEPYHISKDGVPLAVEPSARRCTLTSWPDVMGTSGPLLQRRWRRVRRPRERTRSQSR
jgi:hypothetical protein